MHSLRKSSPQLSVDDLTAYYVFTPQVDLSPLKTRNQPHPAGGRPRMVANRAEKASEVKK